MRMSPSDMIYLRSRTQPNIEPLRTPTVKLLIGIFRIMRVELAAVVHGRVAPRSAGSACASGNDGLGRRPAFSLRSADPLINRYISSCTFLPDRDPDELVWKHLRADTVGRMTITEKADFKARSAHPCAKLQNDPEKIRTKNHRSNMPPDSAFTYGLINNRVHHRLGGGLAQVLDLLGHRLHLRLDELIAGAPGSPRSGAYGSVGSRFATFASIGSAAVGEPDLRRSALPHLRRNRTVAASQAS